jgi:hypothetical protein
MLIQFSFIIHAIIHMKRTHKALLYALNLPSKGSVKMECYGQAIGSFLLKFLFWAAILSIIIKIL